jgi:putative NIF3 family GTP cyclohydrolase 1 type 2
MYGLGAVGLLDEPLSARAFAARVREALDCEGLRVAACALDRTIQTVAVCGGSGASLIGRAIGAGADAFVTADLKYHDFTDAPRELFLVDAGHYETERPFVRVCAAILSEALFPDTENISILCASMVTNPIRFV